VGDSLVGEVIPAGTTIYGLFSSITITSGNAILQLAGYSLISDLVNSYYNTAAQYGYYSEAQKCTSERLNPYLAGGLYDKASWLLIPSQVEEDFVRTFKPTDNSGSLSFTRASDATRTNASGEIERTPWNLVQFSEDFSDVAWIRVFTSVSANTSTAPNGTLTADTLSANGTFNSHLLAQTGNAINGVTYTHSVYAKKGTNNFIQLAGTGNVYTALNVFANFDLNNGVVGSVGAGSTATITNVGNGWYRCTMTATATATASGSAILICLVDSASASRAEANSLTTNVFIWGAQLVEGTDAKPYFPTTNRLDVPRLDYRNADGSLNSCPRLLLEPQRTNLVPNGVLFNASTGVSYDSSITASPAPGVQNATRITKNEAAGNVRYANQNASATLLAGSSVYTLSRYFKYDGFDFQTTMEYNNTANWGGVAWFLPINISSTSITIGSPNACTATIVNMGSGWYRVTATITTGVTIVGAPTYLMRLPSTLSTGQGFLTALPQVELGAFATTFIPTTTAAVTRLVDAAIKTGVSSLIGQTEGTIVWDFNVPDIAMAGNSIQFKFSDGTNSNTIGLVFYSTGRIQFVARVSGPIEASINLPSYGLTDGNHKFALAYKLNDYVAYVDGALVGTDTSAGVPALSDFNLYDTLAGGYLLNQAAIFPTRLSNEELALITTI
jgi:hypothetical protein